MPGAAIHWLRAAVLIAACAGTSLAAQQAQPPPAAPSLAKDDSPAEAARRAKAERAKAKPRKVYTEDDLPALQKHTVSVVGQESTTASPEPKDSEAPPGRFSKLESAVPARDEAYWRGRSGKLRSEIADLDQQIEMLKKEIKESGGAGFDPQSGLGQNVIYYTDRNVRLQRLEKRRAELQKGMDALLDEARKAGVPPGWLR